MQVAARFPIKSNLLLMILIIASHLAVFLIALILLYSIWQILLITFLTLVSFYYSRIQYHSITNASDDLCWSGEQWLMHNESSKYGANYLELLSSSWITPYFCLLKFKHDEKTMAYFFSPKYLGERLYRQLCYLVYLNLKNKNKS